MKYLILILQLSNGAVDFAKSVRNPNFSGGEMKRRMCDEKWIWRFGLNSFVSFLFSRKKRNIKYFFKITL